MRKANEAAEQQTVIEWAAYNRRRWPALKNLYHVPNEAKRTAATGAQLKAMGMSAGVPDLILDYPAGVYHGLRVELKCGKNTPSEAQKDWLMRMQEAGYFVAVAWGAQAAIHLLEEYIALAPGQHMAEDCPTWRTRWGFPALRLDYEGRHG